MKNSIFLVAAAFLCIMAFPTTTVGINMKIWPKPIEGWPNPSEASRNEMFMSTVHKSNYGDSKVWTCTSSNGSAPAISVSYGPPTSSRTPKTSPPPPLTPSPPPPPTPSPRKTSPTPPPTPKTFPPPPVPTLPPSPPKISPSPPAPSEQPFYPPPKHHHHHHHQNGLEHIVSCLSNMGPVTMCRIQMEMTFQTRMFGVSNYCCNLMLNMKNECEDVVLGYFTDPFFVPLLRCTCHVNLNY